MGRCFFVCGDFNIDLLKSNEHAKTAEFVNTMFSLSFHPVITKPSRITLESVTLIDNICINVIDGEIEGGLLVTDISDHLPVFVVLEMNNKLALSKSKQNPSLVRIKSPESIMALKKELINYDWQRVYVEDVNDSYNAFLDIFLTLYNTHCPVKEFRRNITKNRKPWVTKGLEKACTKKNRLYREFLKHRTKDKEDKYKIYKNRLTSIMRSHKKAYYDQLLQSYKNDI